MFVAINENFLRAGYGGFHEILPGSARPTHSKNFHLLVSPKKNYVNGRVSASFWSNILLKKPKDASLEGCNKFFQGVFVDFVVVFYFYTSFEVEKNYFV